MIKPPPQCCGRPGKYTKLTWQIESENLKQRKRLWSVAEFYRCLTCGHMGIPYPIDCSGWTATLEATRLAGIEFDNSLNYEE